MHEDIAIFKRHFDDDLSINLAFYVNAFQIRRFHSFYGEIVGAVTVGAK